MLTKVEIEEHEDLKKEFKDLPKKKDVRELKEYVVEVLENFHEDNEAFRKDFNVQKEIIRSYDEVLSLKESKFMVKTSLESQT